MRLGPGDDPGAGAPNTAAGRPSATDLPPLDSRDHRPLSRVAPSALGPRPLSEAVSPSISTRLKAVVSTDWRWRFSFFGMHHRELGR